MKTTWYQDKNGFWQFRRATGKKPRWCQVLFCKNPSPKYLGISRDLVCNKCRTKRWKLNNPLRAAFCDVRASALKRRIPFLISFEEFQGFLEGTDYLERKGKCLGDLHLDRIDAQRGYEIGNLQILTALENLHKQHFEDYPSEEPEYVCSIGQPF